VTSLAGTGALLRLALRRDRWRLPVWVLAILAVTYGSGSAMRTSFPTQRSIDSYAVSVASSPAVVAMTGPPLGLHTLGGIVINKVALTSLVGVVLVVVLTVVRHTRGEEEDGRTELLRATVVGRHAGSAAALVAAVTVSVVLGAGTALSVDAAGVPPASAWLYGATIAALGLVFAAIALVAAQVFTHARTAVGASLAVFGAAYVVRAAGDVREDWLVWLSPVGWVQATHVLGRERWWPLLVPVVAALLLTGAAVLLEQRRDVGAGLVAARDGSATAARSLSGPVGLAFRVQRGALVGWACGLLLLGAAFGSLARDVDDLVRGNRTLRDYFAHSGTGSPTDSYFATMLLILALVASAFAVSSALRMRGEETSGRLEAVLATGLSRTRWLLGSLVVTAVGSLLLLVAAGLGLGLSYGLAAHDAAQPFRLALLALVYGPAVLVLAAVASLLVGWLPRGVPLAWVVVALCFVVGWLGSLLHPPRWLADLSPFEHTPAVPVDPVSWASLVVLLLVVAALVAAAVAGLRRRDLTA